MPNIYENSPGEAGEVRAWARVVPDSFRVMSVVSPRTGELQTGMFFELEIPGGVQVWEMRTPASGGRMFRRPEKYKETAYLRLREKERREGLRFVVNGKEQKEKRDAGDTTEAEQL